MRKTPASSQPPTGVDGARRGNVRRTAWTFALIALLIYIGFIVSGIVGR